MKLSNIIVAMLSLSLAACGSTGGGHVVVEEFSDCPLCKMAKEGNLEKLQFMLDSGENPNSVSSNEKAFPDQPGKLRDSALRFAVAAGHADIVKVLLDAGANPNLANNNGSTPLSASVNHADGKITKILLDFGADPNIIDKEGGTVLMLASFEGKVEIIKAMLAGGANPNLGNKKSWTALMLATENGHAEVAKVLLEEGANPNTAKKDGWTALNIAANTGQLAVAKVLLECGASPDKRNNEGVNAWHWANRQPAMNAIFRRYLAEVQAGKAINSCAGRKTAATTPPKRANTAEYVFENTWRSVVVIKSGKKQGSGVIIRPNVVATNCHVVDSGGITVYKTDDRRALTDSTYPATIGKRDSARDFCLLEVAGLWGIPANIRAYNTLKVGEYVYALGAPLGLDLSLSSGLISQLRQNGNKRYIQTDTAISPGSSGGGLFDSDGNLIGITTAVHADADAENIGFAIPADLALE